MISINMYKYRRFKRYAFIIGSKNVFQKKTLKRLRSILKGTRFIRRRYHYYKRKKILKAYSILKRIRITKLNIKRRNIRSSNKKFTLLRKMINLKRLGFYIKDKNSRRYIRRYDQYWNHPYYRYNRKRNLLRRFYQNITYTRFKIRYIKPLKYRKKVIIIKGKLIKVKKYVRRKKKSMKAKKLVRLKKLVNLVKITTYKKVLKIKAINKYNKTYRHYRCFKVKVSKNLAKIALNKVKVKVPYRKRLKQLALQKLKMKNYLKKLANLRKKYKYVK